MRTMNRMTMILCIVLILSMTFSGTVVARDKRETNFNDVSSRHWAYDGINLMVDRGVINGYPSGDFEPNEAVTRGQFAKMLVLTLDLELINPSTPTFDDVNKNHWAYKYIETAKYYLTGFKDVNSGEIRYKPDGEAVREDMAVAIVKGLGLEADIDDYILNEYEDVNEISSNLYEYIAKAVDEEIMIGEVIEEERYFNPQDPLTRAQSAVLLARLIEEEKITFDEEKITYDEFDPYDEDCYGEYYEGCYDKDREPYLELIEKNDHLVLEWSEVDKENFKYYKVVASSFNNSPEYPDDGYYLCLTNINETRCEIKAGDWYNGGDINGEIDGGEYYYFTITAVYKDGTETSNVVDAELPAIDDDVINVTTSTSILMSDIESDGIKLYWTPTTKSGFKYYKVVLSKEDSSPEYPTNGYATYITDVNQTEYFLEDGQRYKGYEFSELESDETYYISITACYKDGSRYTSNVLTNTMP